MSSRYQAIDAMMGRLFEEHHRQQPAFRMKSASSGRRKNRTFERAAKGRFSASRMSRVGAQDGNAVFKLVRGAGVKNASGLRGQLNYIFRDDKVARIIDPTNNIKEYDTDMTDKQIARATRDLSENWWSNTRNGNTAHMILSYPQSVSIEDATQITRAVCEEKFNTGDQKYGYIVAIHDDQEHHPHAHIILNRRADDGTLFHMRQGTEHSYEAMREAMAAHAERRGIFLDPTNRFERGNTDRQPTRDEQLAAQKERRAPAQRPRTGSDLAYAQDQLSYGRIVLEGLAVVAANADCQRMEQAFQNLAAIYETSEGHFEMPELTREETERFDQYAELLNDTLQRTQDLLDTKEASERVPMEVRLADTMKDYTALNPQADYAKSLHDAPEGKSIYMHSVSEDTAAWDAGKERLNEISEQYGLDGPAISARLEAGASSMYLEQMWMRDDLKKVALASDLDIDDPIERREAISELSNAYTVIRENMLERDAIETVASLEPAYDRNDYSTLSKDEMNEIHSDLSKADYTYPAADNATQRDAGRQSVAAATAKFVEFSDKSLVHGAYASDVWDRYSQDNLEKPQGYVAEDLRAEYREPEIDQNGQRILTVAEERDFDAALSVVPRDGIPLNQQKTIFEDFAAKSPDHAEYGSKAWDERYEYPVTVEPSGATVPLQGYVGPDNERQLEDTYNADTARDPFAEYRGRDQYELTNDAGEHQEVVALLKENTTDEQYERFRNGDLTAVDHITDDPTMQRQLLAEVEMDNRASGYEMDAAAENSMEANREELAVTFAAPDEQEYDR